MVNNNNILNVVKKSFKLNQFFMQKSFILLLDDRDIGLIFYLALILLPFKQDYILEKNGDE